MKKNNSNSDALATIGNSMAALQSNDCIAVICQLRVVFVPSLSSGFFFTSFSNQPARIEPYNTVKSAEKNIPITEVSVKNDRLKVSVSWYAYTSCSVFCGIFYYNFVFTKVVQLRQMHCDSEHQTLENVPLEILLSISQFMTFPDFACFIRTCSAFHDITTYEDIWRFFFVR